jgi:hypothetical protein
LQHHAKTLLHICCIRYTTNNTISLCNTTSNKGFVACCLPLTSLLYTSFRAPSTELDIFYQNTVINNGRHRSDSTSFVKDKKLQHIQNETLGFQELYMISLPTRTDQQDTFAMQAALSSIKYTQIDGVDGQMVPPKALPHVS